LAESAELGTLPPARRHTSPQASPLTLRGPIAALRQREPAARRSKQGG